MSNTTELVLHAIYGVSTTALFFKIAKAKRWNPLAVCGIFIIVSYVVSAYFKTITGSPVIAFGSNLGWFVLYLLIVIAVPSNTNTTQADELTQEDQKKCPFCAELIKAEAVKCRYCGSLVGNQPKIPAQSEDVGVTCPKCGEAFAVHKSYKGHHAKCPSCSDYVWVSRKASVAS